MQVRWLYQLSYSRATHCQLSCSQERQLAKRKLSGATEQLEGHEGMKGGGVSHGEAGTRDTGTGVDVRGLVAYTYLVTDKPSLTCNGRQQNYHNCTAHSQQAAGT
jgi:hypothetical protein